MREQFELCALFHRYARTFGFMHTISEICAVNKSDMRYHFPNLDQIGLHLKQYSFPLRDRSIIFLSSQYQIYVRMFRFLGHLMVHRRQKIHNQQLNLISH